MTRPPEVQEAMEFAASVVSYAETAMYGGPLVSVLRRYIEELEAERDRWEVRAQKMNKVWEAAEAEVAALRAERGRVDDLEELGWCKK